MKTLILFTMIFTSSFEADAAKPIDPSDSPFEMTVEMHINGHKLGKNLKWTKRESWGDIAQELYAELPQQLVPTDSHIRLLVEWPRYGYDPITLYGCIDENRVLTLHNTDGVCGYSAREQSAIERVRLRKINAMKVALRGDTQSG